MVGIINQLMFFHHWGGSATIPPGVKGVDKKKSDDEDDDGDCSFNAGCIFKAIRQPGGPRGRPRRKCRVRART